MAVAVAAARRMVLSTCGVEPGIFGDVQIIFAEMEPDVTGCRTWYKSGWDAAEECLMMVILDQGSGGVMAVAFRTGCGKCV